MSQLGKRYRCQACGTEILCTKAGEKGGRSVAKKRWRFRSRSLYPRRIEDNPPGHLKKLGLDFEVLSKINSGLILVFVTGQTPGQSPSTHFDNLLHDLVLSPLHLEQLENILQASTTFVKPTVIAC